MPKVATDFVWVGSGDAAIAVGYFTTERNGFLGVRFSGPKGSRLEKMTKCKKTGIEYTTEAARIIATAYQESYPDAKKVTWEDALQVFPADLRELTQSAYRDSVRIMRETLAEKNKKPESPVAVTPEAANQFATFFLNTPFTRSKKEGAKKYKRKPKTLEFHLRQLSAVWSIWQPLGYVKENVWLSVRKPKTDTEVKPVPTEDETSQFFAYIRDRYPQWERLHALLELKAFSACRTKDICSLRTEQVKDGHVLFDAKQVKQREGRTVLVPEELFKRLRVAAGETYLWENWNEDLLKFRKSKNRKVAGFSPETVQCVLENIFREYSDEHPDRPRLTPHGLRRRGITLTVAATGSVDTTAQAIGITADCARSYYLDAKRAFNTDDVFRKLSSILMPKTESKTDTENPHQSPTNKPNNGEQTGTLPNNKNEVKG